MKNTLASSLRLLVASISVLVATQCFTLCTSAKADASTSQPTVVSSQANLTKIINASIRVKHLPSLVKPSLSTLANGGDFGGSLDTSACGYINTNAWKENISHCYYGDTKSKVTVALIGDSRASMYLDTFASLGKQEHFKVLFIAKDGCPAPLGSYMTNNNGKLSTAVWAACSSFHSYLISNLKSIKPRVIVVSSNSTIDLANPAHEAAGPEIQADLTAFLSKMPTSSRVLVLGGFPQPAPTSNPTVCLSRSPSNVSSCGFTPSASTQTDNTAFASAASAAGDVFINQTPWFCTSTCPALIGNYVPYTADAYHADNSYLMFLSGVLWTSIKRYVG